VPLRPSAMMMRRRSRISTPYQGTDPQSTVARQRERRRVVEEQGPRACARWLFTTARQKGVRKLAARGRDAGKRQMVALPDGVQTC
jgi:hypothetical protein